MAITQIIRWLLGPFSVLSIAAFFLAATILLSLSAQNTQYTSPWFNTMLGISSLGILLLALLFIGNLLRLYRQYKKQVLGSRLTARFVALFIVLTLLPISVVYFFAAQFLSKGVDSWFNTTIERTLDDALVLGQNFLDASKQDLLQQAKDEANQLATSSSTTQTIRLLERLRSKNNYNEMALFAANGRIIASSNKITTVLYPDSPNDSDLNTAQNGTQVAKLEPTSNQSLQYRVLVPVYTAEFTQKPNVLQIIQVLPERYSRLTDSIQQAATEYDRLVYLRRPLKISFILALSMITLMTTLISMWLALYAAKRLVAPIHDLAAGTRAVAAGDYRSKIPITSRDEFGMLVRSFNDMTGKLHTAQALVNTNQALLENQRAYLQTLLANLSSGVLSFDADGHLLTANIRAAEILNTPLHEEIDRSLPELMQQHPHLTPLLMPLTTGKAPQKELELTLDGADGPQTLLSRYSAFTEGHEHENGLVVVFDDVSKLINAKREAAWGEVARRLAHEIKNPLTPIQLSAERIRMKILDKLSAEDQRPLDRATKTIIAQVETMKRMVDAFADYAKSDQIKQELFRINPLIQQVIELYSNNATHTRFDLKLEPKLPPCEADKDALRQLLNNLISNSIDATEQSLQPHIRLSTRLLEVKAKAGIELQIEDNGGGIPDAILDTIFEPYVTTKTKGTGLGMAIVRRIIDRHHGTLRAYNTEHSGACIVAWIPLKQIP